jgi:phenylalanyl-tRNA synthetase beta chain
VRYLLSWIREYAAVPDDAKALASALMDLGMNLEASEVLPDETVLDLEITANRPDALSHLGVARELAARYGVPLRKPEGLELPVSAEPCGGVKIVIEDPLLCPRYCGLVVEDARAVPSPAWLVRRLERAGIRPINALVDITNYVLAAVGHPLHAFDLDRLGERTFIVRRARAGERMRTLDGIDRAFRGDECLICDPAGPVALAGVMGGAATEIHSGTRRVLLESAYFDPAAVRRTSRFHALNSEAAQRFSRGADPAMPPRALMLAARLVRELGCGRVEGPILDLHPRPVRPHPLTLRTEALERFFECPFDRAFILRTLRALEFEVEEQGSDYRVVPPPFRADIREEVDLYEELARFYGYNNLPSRMPTITTGKVWELPHLALVSAAQDALVEAGLQEVYSYAFATRRELDAYEDQAPGEPAEIANPLNTEEAWMRRSMVPGLVRTLEANLRKGVERCAFFEVGKVYYRSGEGYGEDLRAGLLLSGPRDFGENREPRPFTFFHLKGIVEVFLGRLRAVDAAFEPAAVRGFVPNSSARIFAGGAPIGVMGQAVVESARHPVWCADVALAPFLDTFRNPPVFRPVPTFPAVRLDLTVGHDAEFPWVVLERAVRGAGTPLLEEVLYKYRFQTPDEVRTTLTLVFQSHERSLTQEEVNAARERIVKHLTAHHPVRL